MKLFFFSNPIYSKMPKIKDMPVGERPREKLLEYGADKLSDAELLAIILRTGVKEKSALDLADEILNKFGGFKGMSGREAVPQINLISLLYIKTHDSKSMLIVSSRHFMCKKE